MELCCTSRLFLQKLAAWVVYAALMGLVVMMARNSKWADVVVNVYQNFNGNYGSVFATILVSTLYLGSLGRYQSSFFSVYQIANNFCCPTPFTTAAVLLLLNNDNDNGNGNDDDVGPNSGTGNIFLTNHHEHMPMLLFSVALYLRFSASKRLEVLPLTRWFSRCSEYLILVKCCSFRIWTPLRLICFSIILCVGRSHELIRLWQSSRTETPPDFLQARRRFRKLDGILIHHLMSSSWPVDENPSPPSSLPDDTIFRSATHRSWLHQHLLLTGLYQHLLDKPEHFSFFWTQGSGLIAPCAAALLCTSSVDMIRQVVCPGHRDSDHEPPLSCILIAVYSAIMFCYLLVQCFPALLARIVEADEDMKLAINAAAAAEILSHSSSTASANTTGRSTNEADNNNNNNDSSTTTTITNLPESSVITTAVLAGNHNNTGNNSNNAEAEYDTGDQENDGQTIDQGRYTDEVMQENLKTLLAELASGKALDSAPQVIDVHMGDQWKWTTPSIIRAIECYEMIPFVLAFGCFQLTIRRFFVSSMSRCLHEIRSVAGARGCTGVGITKSASVVLDKLIPTLVPAAVRLSATDIWRTKRVIVQAEMHLSLSWTNSCMACNNHNFNPHGADNIDSMVLREFHTILPSLSPSDTNSQESANPHSTNSIFFSFSIKLYEFILSNLLQNPSIQPRALSTHQSFHNLLRLLGKFYISPYQINLVPTLVSPTETAPLQSRDEDLAIHLDNTVLNNEYWQTKECGFKTHCTNVDQTDFSLFKTRFCIILLLHGLVHPPAHNSPQVETIEGECIYHWVKERNKQMSLMYNPIHNV